MCDRSISIYTVACCLLWTLGSILVMLPICGVSPDASDLGIIMAGGAVTLNIRYFLAGMSARERSAFNLGVEAGSRGATIHNFSR